MTASYATAFFGGLVTIVAPCAALLLPGFFAYAFTSRATLLGRTGLFLLGLLVALVPMGAAAGSLGQLISTHRWTVATVAGGLIAALGVWQALALPFFHVRLPGRPGGAEGGATPWAVFLLGIGYGLAGAGCTGPILGAVLVVASQTGSPVAGAATMGCYALGMFVPVAVLAFAWDLLDVSGRAWLRPHPVRFLGRETTVGNLISGGLFVVLGIMLMVTGGVTSFGILSARSQQHLESGIIDRVQGIPNGAFVLVLVAVVAAVAALVIWRRGTNPGPTRESEPGSAGADEAEN